MGVHSCKTASVFVLVMTEPMLLLLLKLCLHFDPKWSLLIQVFLHPNSFQDLLRSNSSNNLQQWSVMHVTAYSVYCESKRLSDCMWRLWGHPQLCTTCIQYHKLFVCGKRGGLCFEDHSRGNQTAFPVSTVDLWLRKTNVFFLSFQHYKHTLNVCQEAMWSGQV